MSIALRPSTSETRVGVSSRMASQNFSNSIRIAFTSGTEGFARASVFLPLGVSISKAKTSTSSGVLSLMISVFFVQEIDADIGVFLEQTHLAHAFHRYAAGREIGDAAVVEFDAYAGDVRGIGHDGDAAGGDAFYLTPDEA